jgi:hypothetical protein
MAFIARFALSLTTALVALFFARVAAAEARYMELDEAVFTAEAIAIVHAESDAAKSIQGDYWHYNQVVKARVVETLEGELSERIEIVADKDFVCARVPYDVPGDYLVLLERDAGHLVTVNHGMGRLAIVDGMVDWPYGTGARTRPLEDVVAELRARVKAQRWKHEPFAALLEALPRPTSPASEPAIAAPTAPSFAPSAWIACGALAVLLGFVAARRRR